MAKTKLIAGLCVWTLAAMSPTAQAVPVEITFTNNAPSAGTYLTPLFVGFHDGSYDAFNQGETASTGLATLAEVGNPGILGDEFSAATVGGVRGVVGGGPVAPGASFSIILDLATDGSNSFFNFASMILPSSDFFIGNDDGFSIASVLGGSGPLTFDIVSAYDAGSEVNDFTTSAGNGLFSGIGLPASNAGEGVDENGVVTMVSSDAFGNFLNSGGVDLSGLGFDNYPSLATITITAVPEPAGLTTLLLGFAGIGFVKRRKAAS